MEPWPALAAGNNADWCDIVSRTHGITTATRDGSAWTSRIRTPPLYPDAVTLVAQQPASELLSRIDDAPGCSIKDSFATLDVTRHGFRVLVDAQWIVHGPYAVQALPLDPRWIVVRDLDAFTPWEQAWRGADGPAHVLRPELLRCQDVAVLAAQVDDRIVGGAVLTHSSTVVGISNVFSEEPVGSEIWRGCLELAGMLFPGAPVVGYESGDALDAARAHGFEPVGPLQVWLRDA